MAIIENPQSNSELSYAKLFLGRCQLRQLTKVSVLALSVPRSILQVCLVSLMISVLKKFMLH